MSNTSNKKRIDIKDGNITEVMFEFEQVISNLPKVSGLPQAKANPTVFDSLRRQFIRVMLDLQPGEEYEASFGRSCTVRIECATKSVFRMIITW